MILELYATWVWNHSKIDALILRPPAHDGSPLSIAREVYHRLAARLISRAMYRFQWYILLASVLLLFVLAIIGISLKALSSVTELGGKLAELIVGYSIFIVCGAAIILLPRTVMSLISTDSCLEEAKKVVSRVFLRELERHAPDDLSDPWRHGWITNGGRPISAEITEFDTQTMESIKRAFWWGITCIGLSAAFASVFFPITGMLIVISCIIGKRMFDKNPIEVRAEELEAQSGVEGAAFVAAGGFVWARISEEARRRQVRAAIEDQTLPITLGETTGLLAARGDFHAPSPGYPFKLSLRDLQSHMLVFGGTGSGKTSGILRPIARQVGAWQNLGVLVLDGKGALPAELTDLPGMQILDPAHSIISLVAGVSPMEIANTIVDVLGRESKSMDRFWIDSAGALLRRAAVIARAAGGNWWNLYQIGRIASQQDVVREVAKTLDAAQLEASPILDEAIDFFLEEWPSQDERTRSNIIATLKTWISTITGHPDLLRWAQATEASSPIDITSVLCGGRVGIVVPAHRYGEAGAVITALLKARLFAGLKARADCRGLKPDETPVLLLLDEAQEIATRDDATMLAIGRSLQFAMVAATQTVEGVVEKLKEDVAKKWLGIFGSVVAFPGRSIETDALMIARAGQIWQPSIHEVDGTMVRVAAQASVVSGAIAASQNQSFMRDSVGLQRGELGKPQASSLTRLILHMISQIFLGRRFEPVARRTPVSRIGMQPLIQAGELPTLLAEPDTALVLATRARVIWRDVIRVKPMYK